MLLIAGSHRLLMWASARLWCHRVKRRHHVKPPHLEGKLPRHGGKRLRHRVSRRRLPKDRRNLRANRPRLFANKRRLSSKRSHRSSLLGRLDLNRLLVQELFCSLHGMPGRRYQLVMKR